MLLLFLCGILSAETPNSVKAIVFPLENASHIESLAWLREGVALSISEQIDCCGVEPVSREERIGLVESLDLPPSAQLSRASMIRVAQKASADWIILGAFAGGEQNLRITVRVLNIKSMKLSGVIAANGPLSAMPQMENELSWLILKNSGFEKIFSRETFGQRMRKVPNEAYSMFVQSFEQQNEKDKLRLLLKAVEVYRHFPAAQLEIGRYYFHRGDCDRALAHLIFARSEKTLAPENDYMRGTCYLKANLTDQAIQALSQIAVSSRSYKVFNNLGVAYLRKGETAQALANLGEAGNRARSDLTVSLNLAITLHVHGDNEAALAAIEEAMKAHPKDGMLQFVFGFFLNAGGEYDKAAAAIDRARSLGINVDKHQSEEPRQWMRVLDAMK